MESPGEKICLCDSSKLHTAWMYTVGRLEEMDYFICDRDIFQGNGITRPQGKAPLFLMPK